MELHSDQGRNFESNLFQRVTEVLGIRKTRTTPLHPQSDGMVERFNRTMEEHLSKVVAEHRKDWDRHVPLFLLACRVVSDRMKTRYDLKGNSVGFQADDLVRLYNPRRRKGPCPKLLPNWEGSYTVDVSDRGDQD